MLEGWLAQAEARAYEPGRLGFELCRKILSGLREARWVRPDLVRRLGCYLIEHHSSRLGREVWSAYEQVMIALLHYGKQGADAEGSKVSSDLVVAQEYFRKLSAQFPDSLRVKRLEGMLMEAKGKPDLAMKQYEVILTDEPNHIQATKRQIALCRARGKISEATTRLVKYLETVSSDTEAWLQLAAIYLNAQQFKRAAFCMEELILINPMSYLYHLRYGDIMFTIGSADKGGGTEQLRIARKYYAHALDLKPQDNLRAIYGLLLASAALGPSSTKGAKGSTKTDNAEVFTYARTQLIKLYSDVPGPIGKMVQGMLATLIE